jgi:hypothetical protein
VRVDPARAARDQRDARMRVEERDLPLEALGRAAIVGVHAREIAAASARDGEVQRARHAEVLLVLDPLDPRSR